MMNKRLSTKYLMISGRVQGVSYRRSFEKKANKLSVKGWVRNKSDGTVEAEIQGQQEVIEALIAWAHTGPLFARVDHVQIEEIEREVYPEFNIIY